ncbi:hypothetical protein BaRGS_00018032 [Batillaria attramentaria]|uniref:Uncharacterized protein n=1 Tax=Batillaria attramentaria TaxID=370345 RepID=A0ABD0KV50_9CAEN
MAGYILAVALNRQGANADPAGRPRDRWFEAVHPHGLGYFPMHQHFLTVAGPRDGLGRRRRNRSESGPSPTERLGSCSAR